MKKSQQRSSAGSGDDLLQRLAEAAQREQDLRSTNTRLARQLYRAKAKTEDYVEAVRQAVLDSVGSIVVPAVKRPTLPRKARTADEEKALVTLGDPQFGKVTPTYNRAIAGERLDIYAGKIDKLVTIARTDHPVHEARVYLLGDMVEGEIIFPQQQSEVDASLFDQIRDAAEAIVRWLRQLLVTFSKLHVVGIVGNHGRLSESRRYGRRSNADRILYLLIRSILDKEPRITWNVPDEDWYVVDHPFGGERPGFLLFHGNEIPGSAAHSVGTVAKHIYGWASGAVPEPFNYAIYGHWHTPRRYRFNRFIAWCNGSLESTSTYAQEKLAAVGYPEQLVMFVHPRRGVSSEYWCQLGEEG